MKPVLYCLPLLGSLGNIGKPLTQQPVQKGNTLTVISSKLERGKDIEGCFNVENLDKTLEVINKRNVNIIRCFSVPAIGKRVAFIADPFGNAIEFCEDLKYKL